MSGDNACLGLEVKGHTSGCIFPQHLGSAVPQRLLPWGDHGKGVDLEARFTWVPSPTLPSAAVWRSRLLNFSELQISFL